GLDVVIFSPTFYLGLPQRRAENPPRRSDSGATASPLVCGWTREHDEFTRRLAEFESAEAALLLPCGYSACMASVSTLAEAGDLILSDQLNHASLIDGCRLSKAETFVYPHRDVDAAGDYLRKQRHRFDAAWWVTDTVFSMDGHVAPLVDVCRVAAEFDVKVIADEAHATGVLGPHGGGLVEATATGGQIAVRVGTLSKAIASQGGFLMGDRQWMEYYVNFARPLIYSTALSLAAVRDARWFLDHPGQVSSARDKVRSLSRRLRKQLGIESNDSDGQDIENEVPIIPWHVGEDRDALRLQRQLAVEGFLVPAIRPPTVPEGTARLRISVSAVHTEAEIDRLAEAVKKLI
ncbi:MAG: aminotransferase class I/II-fold pyridoxal phosphate-dependent enzyme, partial [Planctomycetota bacterium]